MYDKVISKLVKVALSLGASFGFFKMSANVSITHPTMPRIGSSSWRFVPTIDNCIPFKSSRTSISKPSSVCKVFSKPLTSLSALLFLIPSINLIIRLMRVIKSLMSFPRPSANMKKFCLTKFHLFYEISTNLTTSRSTATKKIYIFWENKKSWCNLENRF